MSIASPCVKCEDEENTNGLFTCNGCTEHFCTNHIHDHTNELRNRFEEIIDEYNVVKDIFEDCKRKFSDRQWKLIDRLGRELQQIKHQLDQCQKTSNFSEGQSKQWMDQLNRLKNQLLNIKPPVLLLVKIQQIVCSKLFLICLLLISAGLAMYCVRSTWKSRPFFTKADEVISLSLFEKTAEHIGQDYVLGSVRLNSIYTNDIHHVRFLIEKLSPSSKSSIGIINRQSGSSSSCGQFIKGDEAFNYNSKESLFTRVFRRFWWVFRNNHHIQPNDTLDLEINCTNAQITLQNLRTQQKYPVNVDLKRCPFPWQIILHLDRRGDRIHIL